MMALETGGRIGLCDECISVDVVTRETDAVCMDSRMEYGRVVGRL